METQNTNIVGDLRCTKFKEAGCLSLGFSLESANKEILKLMNKRIEAQYFLDQVKILDQVGGTSMISVVFGYPIETKETIKETFDMCLTAGVYPSMGYYCLYLRLECMTTQSRIIL